MLHISAGLIVLAYYEKKTLFILPSFYAPHSDILASAETPAPEHKD